MCFNMIDSAYMKFKLWCAFYTVAVQYYYSTLVGNVIEHWFLCTAKKKLLLVLHF